MTSDNCRNQAAMVCENWDRLRDAMQYALDNYENYEAYEIEISDGSSHNCWWCPGIVLSEEGLFESDRTGCMIYVHEPMHDFWQEGLGHDGINDVVGPYTYDNDFQRLWDLNNSCKKKPKK